MPKNKMAAFAGIGFELIALLLGAVYLGQYIEGRVGGKGLLTAGLVVLAFIGWIVHLVVMLKPRDEDPKA